MSVSRRAAALVSVGGALVLAAVTSTAFATSFTSPGTTAAATNPAADRLDLSRTIDVRAGTTMNRRGLAAAKPVNTAAAAARIGGQAVVDIDPFTGTARQLARLDGLL